MTSIKASKELFYKMIDYYKDYEIKNDNSLYFFVAKIDDVKILFYQNMTVLFQGKNIENEMAKWCDIEISNPIQANYEVEHIGSDEVGCGDYFGPIVVCATHVKLEDISYLKSIGVRDSKQLKDENIKVLAEKIKERIHYVEFVLTNKKYNEIHHEKNYNLNKIKSYLHNFVLFKLVQKENFDKMIVVDQFCSEQLYYSYLKDYKTNDIQRNITFTTKAENKFLAVACASIIARATFLKEIENLEIKLGHKIILGASDKVDQLAKEIIEEKGVEFLKPFVKYHYKNTEKVLELIKGK